MFRAAVRGPLHWRPEVECSSVNLKLRHTSLRDSLITQTSHEILRVVRNNLIHDLLLLSKNILFRLDINSIYYDL